MEDVVMERNKKKYKIDFIHSENARQKNSSQIVIVVKHVPNKLWITL